VPKRNHDIFTTARYRRFFQSTAVTPVPLSADVAERFADLRASTRVKPADALHLALAASAGADYFVTTDTKLHSLAIPGISRICPQTPFHRPGPFRVPHSCALSSCSSSHRRQSRFFLPSLTSPATVRGFTTVEKSSSKTGGTFLNRSNLSGASRPFATRRLVAGAIFLFLLSALPSAIGCKSTPSNPMIGAWKLAVDGTGPKVCGVSAKMTFTSNTSETWNDKGLSGGPAMISYVVELPNIFIPGPGGAVSYTMSGDQLIWHSPYGPCTYSRA